MGSTPIHDGSLEAALLDGLDASQHRAVTHEASPLRIEAGAGSGKTRVLTRRIAWRAATGRIDPRRVLALTFTRKAAGELHDRLRALGLRDVVAAGTFHAIAYAQLRSWWADRGVRPPTLLDRKVGLVARVLPTGGRGPSPLDVVTEIEWAKARALTPERYPQAATAGGRKPAADPALVARTFASYEAEKRERRLVDFDDLLRICRQAILEDTSFAAAQHWRFRHLFVDEFQDVNPLQFALLQAWLGPEADLCVVGDPNQSIYGWNGADCRYLRDLDRHLPGAESVRLDQNYRSSPQILTLAGSLVARGRPRPVLEPNRPDGAVPTIVRYETDQAEARGIARRIRELRAPGGPWSAQAVLVRTNAQAALLAEAFSQAEIPYRLRGGSELLRRPEVRSALSGLRASGFEAGLVDLTSSLPRDAVDPETDEREANVQALVRLAQEYAALDPSPSTNGFEAWLTTTVGGERVDERDAVEIATFHAAKGLEWHTVHVAGLERGLVPIGHATSPEALEEERRLLYVALTRAEQRLSCSWAAERTFGTRTVSRSPSPFLDRIEEAIATLRDATGEDWRPHLREQKRRVSAARADHGRTASGPALDPAAQEAFETLRRWRSGAARAAGVPAYVILHDRTLREIAQRRPASVEDLLDISGIGPVKATRYGPAILEALGSVLTT